jgi:hypothetical protein
LISGPRLAFKSKGEVRIKTLKVKEVCSYDNIEYIYNYRFPEEINYSWDNPIIGIKIFDFIKYA